MVEKSACQSNTRFFYVWELWILFRLPRLWFASVESWSPSLASSNGCGSLRQVCRRRSANIVSVCTCLHAKTDRSERVLQSIDSDGFIFIWYFSLWDFTAWLGISSIAAITSTKLSKFTLQCAKACYLPAQKWNSCTIWLYVCGIILILISISIVIIEFCQLYMA